MFSCVNSSVFSGKLSLHHCTVKEVRLLATRNHPVLERINTQFANKKVDFKLLLSFICISKKCPYSCLLHWTELPKEPVNPVIEEKKMCGRAVLHIKNTPVCVFWLKNFNSDELIVCLIVKEQHPWSVYQE